MKTIITLDKLRETRQRARRGDGCSPITAEIDDTVAGWIKRSPNDSNETIREDVELQMEVVSISPEYIEELAGFFRDNPQVLDTFLAEGEEGRLEEAAKPTFDLSHEEAWPFLNQHSQ